MKYPFGSEPNTWVVFPVLSFTFTNEVTLQVPTSCCLSGSAAPADSAAHVRAAAIGIDHSAFMVLPPVFRHVASMTGSGPAAQSSQSLENIARGTRRSNGAIHPTIPHRRPVLDRPHQAVGMRSKKAIGQNAKSHSGRLCQVGPHGRRSCGSRRARKPATKVRFWPLAEVALLAGDVRCRG